MGGTFIRVVFLILQVLLWKKEQTSFFVLCLDWVIDLPISKKIALFSEFPFIMIKIVNLIYYLKNSFNFHKVILRITSTFANYNTKWIFITELRLKPFLQFRESILVIIIIMKLSSKQQSSNLDKSKSTSKGKQQKQVPKAKIKQNKGKERIQPQVPAGSTAIIGKSWDQIQVTLRQQILDSLQANNYKTMFPVQEAAIPLLLKNYDLAVEAQTGSGKTLSFMIPLLQKYLSLNDPLKQMQNEEEQLSKVKIKYLLISPTRQLCQQSYSVLTKLLNKLPDKRRRDIFSKYCYCATGGSELEQDLERIKSGVYVLMGTVGRLRQIGQKFQQDWLKKVDYLFIDEADRVLKEKGIQELIKSIQKLRRTAMFSATLQGMQAKNFQFFGMRNLAKISLKAIQTTKSKQQNTVEKIQKAKSYVIPKSLNNTYIVMKNRLQKMHFLINFLQQQQDKSKIIVFLSTCASVDYYTKIINLYFQDKNTIFGIHGKLKTRRRKRIIQEFMQKKNGVLFATDVVSRGIDFQHIHYILQVDPPQNPDNYIHRIGRTARVNRPGTAILLIEEQEEAFITYLEDKGVGVKLVERQFFTKQSTAIELITQRIFDILIADRDNIQKGKKAFVSYVRAYKQHELRYIFEFKNVDVGMIAHSFFLFRIPRIKEILGKNITSFKQSVVDIQQIPWQDKNQQQQYASKQEYRDQLRQQRDLKAKPSVDIKNVKSKRKKIRRKNQQKEMSQMNKLHKEILKEKKAKTLTKGMDVQSEEDSDQDTEQLEARVAQKGNYKF